MDIQHISQMPADMVKGLLHHPPEWHSERAKGIGGSDANIIANGSAEKLHQLWLQKIGKAKPENLDDVVCVQIGKWTEPLNRLFFEKQLNTKVFDVNVNSYVHPLFPFIRANLDGMARVNGELCVIESKHLVGFSDFEEAAGLYYPQIQHGLMLTGCSAAYLSAFEGVTRYKYLRLEADPGYQNDLLSREIDFWDSVQRQVPPSADPLPEIILGLDDMREIDMTGSNSWANAASDFLENEDAAKKFETAKKDLKDLIAPDVKLATGSGVQVKRSKNKSLRISKMKG